MKKILVLVAALLPILAAAAPKSFTLNSPNGRIVATIERGKTITYSLAFDGKPVLDPSAVAMDLKEADDFNGKAKFQKAITASEDELIPTVAYKRAVHAPVQNLRPGTPRLRHGPGLSFRLPARQTGNGRRRTSRICVCGRCQNHRFLRTGEHSGG